MNRIVGMVATTLLLCACQTAPKPDNDIQIMIGPDGKMTVVLPPNASPEEQMMAAIMSGTLDEAAAEAAELSEKEIWRTDGDDNLTHIQSGVSCPPVWAGMKRDRISIFRKDGMDVGCNYLSPNSPTVMTFYAFTLPGDATPVKQVLRDTLDTMKTRQPTAKETPYLAASRNGQYEALTLAYENADGTRMRTSVLIAQVGEWLLKIRLTCRAEDALMAEETAGVAIIGQTDRLRTRPVPKTALPDPV